MMNSICDPSHDHTSLPGRSQRIGGQTLTGVQRFVPQHFGWVSARWDERLENGLCGASLADFHIAYRCWAPTKEGKETIIAANWMQNKSNHSMNIICCYEYPTCYCAVTVGKTKNADVFFFLFGPTVFHCFNVVLLRIQHDPVVRCWSDRLTNNRSALKFFWQKTCISFLLIFDVWVTRIRKYNGYNARLYCQIFAQDNFPPFCAVYAD